MSRGFEDRAADWIRFARAEGHDAYWAYRDAFVDLLPPAPGRTFEIGCGEGRVSRDLRSRGYDVTGLDVAPTLVDAARAADPNGTYVVGDAAALPFDDGDFDLVVSYNSLIDVEDMRAAVAEAGGVLRPGGSFCACVPHPFSEAGEFETVPTTRRSSSPARTSPRQTTSSSANGTGSSSASPAAGSRSSRTPARSRPRGSGSRHCASRRSRVSRATVASGCRCSSCGGR